jgi:hypothetical protein
VAPIERENMVVRMPDGKFAVDERIRPVRPLQNDDSETASAYLFVGEELPTVYGVFVLPLPVDW